MFRVTSLPPIIYRYDFTPSKHSPNKSILKVKFELSRCSRLRRSPEIASEQAGKQEYVERSNNITAHALSNTHLYNEQTQSNI